LEVEGLVTKRKVLRALRIINLKTGAIVEGSAISTVFNGVGLFAYSCIVIMGVILTTSLLAPNSTLKLLHMGQPLLKWLQSWSAWLYIFALCGVIFLGLSRAWFISYRNTLIPHKELRSTKKKTVSSGAGGTRRKSKASRRAES